MRVVGSEDLDRHLAIPALVRSTISSRSIPTNLGSVPTVPARTIAKPSSSASDFASSSRSYMTSM